MFDTVSATEDLRVMPLNFFELRAMFLCFLMISIFFFGNVFLFSGDIFFFIANADCPKSVPKIPRSQPFIDVFLFSGDFYFLFSDIFAFSDDIFLFYDDIYFLFGDIFPFSSDIFLFSAYFPKKIAE